MKETTAIDVRDEQRRLKLIKFGQCAIKSPFKIIISGTAVFFEEWNELTPQTHLRKFKELTAW